MKMVKNQFPMKIQYNGDIDMYVYTYWTFQMTYIVFVPIF